MAAGECGGADVPSNMQWQTVQEAKIKIEAKETADENEFSSIAPRTSMWSIETAWFDVAIIMSMFAVGNILFGHFEEHKPKWRRLLKVAIFWL